MQRIALLAACALVASCHRTPTEGGIQANVHVDTDAFVTCVQLSALDTAGNTLGTTVSPVKGQQVLSFAISQGDYPADISLHVVGLFSVSDCTDPALPNSQPADLTGLHFKAGVQVVDLTLHKPTSADDADSDGFTSSAKGGPDCDDANPNANPGADERCTDLVDLNCNNRYGCDDPACTGKTCLSPPSSVAFASSPQSAAAMICSGAIVVELHDATGASVPAGVKTTVSLAEMGSLGLTVYSDSGCTVPAMSADIAKGQRQARFYARGAKSGSTMLQATATGLSAATQAFVVAPGAATAVFFTSAPQTVKADRCSEAVTLETRDLQMNAAPVAADVPYTVTPNPGTGLSLFSDATCTTPLGSPKIASGTSSVTFFFRPVRMPGMVTLSVAAPPLAGAMQVETVDPGDPAALTFTTSSQMVGAGNCSSALTVQLVDAHGVNTTPASGMTVALAGPSFSFFTDAMCMTPANGSATFSPTSGAATVYFKATTAGMSTVTASGGGLPNAMQTETIKAAAPMQLVFANGVGGVPQSTCSGPATLTVKDQYGNTAQVTGVPLTIQLQASPSTGFTFYQAGACSSATNTVQIPVGQSSVGFNFFGTMAGMVTLTAVSGLQPNPTQTINIGVGPPTKLVFTTAPQTKKANACSGAVTLQAQDSGGNVVSLAMPLTVNLAANPPAGFSFYSDAACNSATSMATIPQGASQTSYWFKGTAAGMVTMSPSSTLMNPTQVATIQPEVASALAFTNMPLTVTAGVCSATALALQSRDAYGNPSAVAADTAVMLSAMPNSNLTFFSDPGCGTAVAAVTLANGASAAQFYVKANAAPSYALQAQAASLGTASQALTVNPAAASQLVILTSSQTKQTGQCSGAVTVQRQDAFGNPVTAGSTTVMLSQNPAGGGLQFFSNMGCSTAAPSVTIGAGASTANVFFSGSLPGMPTLIASSGSLTPASQMENINVSPASKLAFITASQTSVPAGSCSAVVTAQSQDPLGNASPVASDTTLTLGAPPSGAAYYSDPGCSNVITQATLSAGTSQTSWYFKGTVALTFMLSATAPSLGAASQSETIVPAGLSQLVFLTAARSQSVGQCSQKLTVQRQDTYGNPVTTGTLTVNLAATPSAGFQFFADGACPGASPVTSVMISGGSTVDFYYKGTAPGTVHVTASGTGAGSVGQDETVSAVPPSGIVFTTPARSVAAGSCSLVLTLQAKDGFGNPSPVASSTPVTLSGSAGNMTFFTDAACTMNTGVAIPAGMTDASFYATGTTVSTPMITANAGALLGSTSQGFTITAGAPNKLVFTTGSQALQVAQCSGPVTVQVQDANGNVAPVPGPTTLTAASLPSSLVTFFQDAACSMPLGAGLSLTAGSTSGTLYMKGGNVVQGGTIQVSSAQVPNPTPTQSTTVNPGPPKQLAYTTGQKPNLMAGECSTAITVALEDVAGNATSIGSATTVNLGSGAAPGFAFYSDASCSTSAPSVSIAANTSTISFYVKGTTGTDGTNIVMTASSGTLTSATQNIIVLNAVVAGTCTLANGTSSIVCAISPALKDTTRTLLMFQAANNGTGPDDSMIRCELTDTGHVSCFRGGTNGDVLVTWYTLSLFSGLSVQHIKNLTASGAMQTVNFSAVNTMNDTFLLMSSDFAGTTYNNQAMTSAKLTSTSQVTLTRLAAPSSTMRHAIQVVEWTGATVIRNAALTSIANNSDTSGNLSVTDSGTAPTFLLSTARWDDASSNEPCRTSTHGTIVNSTTLAFTRAVGATGNCNNNQIDIEYERVTLPVAHRVDAYGPAPAAGMDGTPVTNAMGYDLTRALAFFSGQGINGQSSGECSDTTVDRPRDCTMRATFLDANNVAPQRPTVSGSTSAAFSMYVLQVSP